MNAGWSRAAPREPDPLSSQERSIQYLSVSSLRLRDSARGLFQFRMVRRIEHKQMKGGRCSEMDHRLVMRNPSPWPSPRGRGGRFYGGNVTRPAKRSSSSFRSTVGRDLVYSKTPCQSPALRRCLSRMRFPVAAPFPDHRQRRRLRS